LVKYEFTLTPGPGSAANGNVSEQSPMLWKAAKNPDQDGPISNSGPRDMVSDGQLLDSHIPRMDGRMCSTARAMRTRGIVDSLRSRHDGVRPPRRYLDDIPKTSSTTCPSRPLAPHPRPLPRYRQRYPGLHPGQVGATCYMNSMLQALMHVPPFVDHLSCSRLVSRNTIISGQPTWICRSQRKWVPLPTYRPLRFLLVRV
jgi:Ubiquitin carboxyl-terminal hydrolase